MKKYFLLAVALLLSVPALAQTNVTTGRVQFINSYTLAHSRPLYTTLNTWEVLNQGLLPTGSCIGTPIINKPSVIQHYDANAWNPATAFKTNMGYSWSYPSNVNITSLTVRICYHLHGSVPLYSILVPILRDATNGDIYEPTNGGITIFPGNYIPNSSTQATSVTIPWDLSGWPLSSADLYNGRFEFGFRVKNYPPPWVLFQPPVPDAIRIHGIEIKANFVTTPSNPNTPTPSIVYTPPYASGSVAVTVNMPPPSSGVGVRLAVLCNSGFYENLADIGWGANANQWNQRTTTRSYSTNALRTACTQRGTTLNQNSQTRVRARLLNGSAQFGNDTYSNYVTIN